MIRLGHFVTHPIQYFAPLYRALSARTDVQLTVLFGSRFGLTPSFDEGFGRTIQYDVPLLEDCVMIIAVIYMLSNLAADLFYAYLNPQVRYSL